MRLFRDGGMMLQDRMPEEHKHTWSSLVSTSTAESALLDSAVAKMPTTPDSLYTELKAVQLCTQGC